MRKFKVECLFDSFGGEDTHWQNDETKALIAEIESQNYDVGFPTSKNDERYLLPYRC